MTHVIESYCNTLADLNCEKTLVVQTNVKKSALFNLLF